MNPFERFSTPQGWRIREWIPPTVPSCIPSNGFVKHGTVLIGRVCNGSQSCSLSWLDGNNKLCSILDLPFDGDTALTKDRIMVSFGEGDVLCSSVRSYFDKNGDGMLCIELHGAPQDGNTGTIRAEAVPPPCPDPD